ncbi:MAG: hypothetical protein ACP5GD_01045 [Candidatus Micrarchaeia archaeon]
MNFLSSLGDQMYVDSGIAPSIFSQMLPDLNFVSHAHSDHYRKVRNYSKIAASEETKEVMEARGKIGLSLENLGNEFRMLDAGHVLGSKQLYASLDGASILYSGDYQMTSPILGNKIETVEADVLLIDSTYSSLGINFDDKNETITAIQHYVRQKVNFGSILFTAYAFGKAQELIKIMNEIGIVPTVSEEIAKISEVYARHGANLYYFQYLPGDELKGNFVGIFTNKDVKKIANSMSHNFRRYFTAVATGWAKIFKFGTSVQFALSDHADFKQALEYISAVNPRTIVPVGDGAETFAKRLIRLGYNAISMGSHRAHSHSGQFQLQLTEKC